MENEPQAGDICEVSRDIIINGETAFEQGERVMIEAVSPDPAVPEFKFKVFSQRMNTNLRLRENDIGSIVDAGPADRSAVPSVESTYMGVTSEHSTRHYSYLLGLTELVVGALYLVLTISAFIRIGRGAPSWVSFILFALLVWTLVIIAGGIVAFARVGEHKALHYSVGAILIGLSVLTINASWSNSTSSGYFSLGTASWAIKLPLLICGLAIILLARVVKSGPMVEQTPKKPQQAGGEESSHVPSREVAQSVRSGGSAGGTLSDLPTKTSAQHVIRETVKSEPWFLIVSSVIVINLVLLIVFALHSYSPGKPAPSGSVSGIYFNSLSYDKQSGVLYGCDYEQGIFRCDKPETDSPKWTYISTGLGANYIGGLALDPSRQVLYAGCYTESEDQNLVDKQGVWCCKNPRSSSPSWSSAGKGLTSYGVGSIAWDTTHDALYAGTDQNGLWRCSNPASSSSLWQRVGKLDISAGCLLCDPSHGILYAGSPEKGVWRCDNPRSGEPTWTRLGDMTWGDDLTLDRSTTIIYALNGEYGVRRCDNVRTTGEWKDISGVLGDNSPVDGLAYDAKREILYAGVTQSVWRCTNPAGASPTWSDIGGILKEEIVSSITYDAENDRLYASPYQQGVWRCDNPRDMEPSWVDVSGTSRQGDQE